MTLSSLEFGDVDAWGSAATTASVGTQDVQGSSDCTARSW